MFKELFATATEASSNVLEGIDGVFVEGEDIEAQIASYSVRVVLTAAVLLAIFVITAVLFNDKKPVIKKPLFILISLTVGLSTLFLAGSTIYLNVNSDSGGPVHWHADIEFWACGNELELRDPVGFSNKIGTSTLHEHDDHRIHLEGVVVDETVDASLGKFMAVTGGALTPEALVVPLNPDGQRVFEDEVDGDGESSPNAELVSPYIVTDNLGERYARFESGNTCGDQEAEVQVFVYQFNSEDNTYSQIKLDNPVPYSYAREPIVPPGDCVIFEFDVPKAATDKLCAQYGVRDSERCTEFGLEEYNDELCNIREVNKPEQNSSDFPEFSEPESPYQEYEVDEEDLEYNEEEV